MQRSWTTALVIMAGVVALHGQAHAAALGGIQFESFLTTFQGFVVGLGLIMGLVGLTGWVGSMFDNPFSNILAGSVGFFSKAGILGGGVTILGLTGLAGGAVLL